MDELDLIFSSDRAACEFADKKIAHLLTHLRYFNSIDKDFAAADCQASIDRLLDARFVFQPKV
jgi:hypothetical protein